MGCGLSACRESKNSLGPSADANPYVQEPVGILVDTDALLENEVEIDRLKIGGDDVDDMEKELLQLEDGQNEASPPPTMDESLSDQGLSPVPIAAIVTLKTLESPRSVIFATGSRPTSASPPNMNSPPPTFENSLEIVEVGSPSELKDENDAGMAEEPLLLDAQPELVEAVAELDLGDLGADVEVDAQETNTEENNVEIDVQQDAAPDVLEQLEVIESVDAQESEVAEVDSSSGVPIYQEEAEPVDLEEQPSEVPQVEVDDVVEVNDALNEREEEADPQEQPTELDAAVSETDNIVDSNDQQVGQGNTEPVGLEEQPSELDEVPGETILLVDSDDLQVEPEETAPADVEEQPPELDETINEADEVVDSNDMLVEQEEGLADPEEPPQQDLDDIVVGETNEIVDSNDGQGEPEETESAGVEEHLSELDVLAGDEAIATIDANDVQAESEETGDVEEQLTQPLELVEDVAEVADDELVGPAEPQGMDAVDDSTEMRIDENETEPIAEEGLPEGMITDSNAGGATDPAPSDLADQLELVADEEQIQEEEEMLNADADEEMGSTELEGSERIDGGGDQLELSAEEQPPAIDVVVDVNAPDMMESVENLDAVDTEEPPVGDEETEPVVNEEAPEGHGTGDAIDGDASEAIEHRDLESIDFKDALTDDGQHQILEEQSAVPSTDDVAADDQETGADTVDELAEHAETALDVLDLNAEGLEEANTNVDSVVDASSPDGQALDENDQLELAENVDLDQQQQSEEQQAMGLEESNSQQPDECALEQASENPLEPEDAAAVEHDEDQPLDSSEPNADGGEAESNFVEETMQGVAGEQGEAEVMLEMETDAADGGDGESPEGGDQGESELSLDMADASQRATDSDQLQPLDDAELVSDAADETSALQDEGTAVKSEEGDPTAESMVHCDDDAGDTIVTEAATAEQLEGEHGPNEEALDDDAAPEAVEAEMGHEGDHADGETAPGDAGAESSEDSPPGNELEPEEDIREVEDSVVFQTETDGGEMRETSDGLSCGSMEHQAQWVNDDEEEIWRKLQKDIELEEQEQQLQEAAVRIQSSYRGYRVRREMKNFAEGNTNEEEVSPSNAVEDAPSSTDVENPEGTENEAPPEDGVNEALAGLTETISTVALLMTDTPMKEAEADAVSPSEGESAIDDGAEFNDIQEEPLSNGEPIDDVHLLKRYVINTEEADGDDAPSSDADPVSADQLTNEAEKEDRVPANDGTAPPGEEGAKEEDPEKVFELYVQSSETTNDGLVESFWQPRQDDGLAPQSKGAYLRTPTADVEGDVGDQETTADCGEKENAAATKIQAGYRGFRDRKRCQENKQKSKEHQELEQNHPMEEFGKREHSAASTIQAGYRGYRDRKNMVHKKKQAAADDMCATRPVEKDPTKHIQFDSLDEQIAAATKIQANYRGYRSRNQLKRRSSDMRDEVAKRDVVAATSACVAETDEGMENMSLTTLDLENLAATKIQANYRGYRDRKLIAANCRTRVSVEEAGVKGNHAAGMHPTEESKHLAATKIQANYRGFRVRKEIKNKKNHRTRAERKLPFCLSKHRSLGQTRRNSFHEDRRSQASAEYREHLKRRRSVPSFRNLPLLSSPKTPDTANNKHVFGVNPCESQD